MPPPLSNWAENVVFQPREIHFPATDDEVGARVRAADGRRIRAVGSLHSWSEAPRADDILVSLQRLSGVRAVDRERGEVRVAAGTTLRELNAALADAGMALPILGSIDAQTVAGAVSTGTHGSSLTHGSLASLVREVRLVDGRGDVVTVGPDDPRLDGARLSLGALGVVTELVLTIEPAFTLVEELERVPFDTACADLPQIAASAEYVKVWWLPHVDEALIFRYHRGADAPPYGALARALDERFVYPVLFEALLRFGALVPAVVPPVNRLIVPIAFGPRRRGGPSAEMLCIPMPPRNLETESAIPVERAGEALDALRTMIARQGHSVNFMQELRFGPAESAWLAGAYARPSCHFGAYLSTAFAHRRAAADRYFADVHALLAPYDPRPHWGKAVPTAAGYGARLPRAADFQALREAFDPQRRFDSAFLRHAFQPPSPTP